MSLTFKCFVTGVTLQSVSPCIQSIMCSAWGHTPFCAYCVAKRDLKCERRDYKLELWNPFFRSDAVNGTRVSSSARRSNSRELEQHKVHYRWVMFRHRCLSQRVPWHFGQLEDSLWFLFVIRIKKGAQISLVPAVLRRPFSPVFYVEKVANICKSNTIWTAVYLRTE